MGSPPKTLEAWMAGGPWSESPVTFEEWVASARSWEKGDTEGLHPFPRVGHPTGYHRFAHEVAHLIICPDEDLFCPWWGLVPGTTKEPANLITEAKVFGVEDRLYRHFGRLVGSPKSRYRPEWLGAAARTLAYMEAGGRPTPDTVRFYTDKAAEAKSQWTIKAMWEEVQRKYTLAAT